MSRAKNARMPSPEKKNHATGVDSFLPLTPATFHILLTLEDSPMHGYGVKRVVEERTGSAVTLSAGTLYTAVQRLENTGLIHEVEAPDPEAAAAASSRWRFYGCTDLGRQVLRAELRRLEADVRAGRAILTGEA